MATVYGDAPGAILPNNVGGLGTFQAYKAPTTGSTVYTSTVASGANAGRTVYVGPDNQPYLSNSAAIKGNVLNGIFSFNPANFTKVTWSSLLGAAAPVDANVSASTYAGPGANTAAQDYAAYNPGATLAGENLVVGGGATVATAGLEAVGTYAGGSSLNLSPAVAQPAAIAAPGGAPTSDPALAFIAAVQAAAKASASAVTLPSVPTTLTSTGTGQSVNVSTTNPAIANGIVATTPTTDGSSATTNASASDALNAALANNINGGYSTSPLDAVNGSPSEAAGLEALQPTAVQTGGTSKSNPILLWVIIGIVAIIAFVVYLKLRHKGPPPPGTSTAHSIATGDKIEPVTA